VTDSLRQAIAAFNRGDYFGAGEQFEQALTTAEAEVKDLIGALNRVAAALHLRLDRGGRQAAINLLSQAMLMMEDLGPSMAGIDIARLSRELSAFTDDLRASPRQEGDGLKHRARLFIERRRAPKIKFI
jgi:hypothetical protein